MRRRKKPKQQVPTRFVEHRAGEPPKLSDVTGRVAVHHTVNINPSDIEKGLKNLTTEQADAILAQNVKGYAAPQPKPEPVLTQAEIKALTQPEKKDETWSEAVKGMLLAIGAVVIFIWLVAIGVGGCAAFVFVMEMLQKALQW